MQNLKHKRPKITEGETTRIRTGCGNLYVTLGWDGNFLTEVFAHLGKSGGCAMAQMEATTRLLSLALKYNVPLEEIVNELRLIRCPSPITTEDGEILSCADGIANILKSIQTKSSNGKENKESE